MLGSNALSPREETFSGIVTCSIELLLNASAPIVVILLWISMLVNSLPANALKGIDEIVLGISIVFNLFA